MSTSLVLDGIPLRKTGSCKKIFLVSPGEYNLAPAEMNSEFRFRKLGAFKRRMTLFILSRETPLFKHEYPNN